jgi:hypothetical protein
MSPTFDVSSLSSFDERGDGHYLHRAKVETNLGNEIRARSGKRMRFIAPLPDRRRIQKTNSGKHGKITDAEILEGTLAGLRTDAAKEPPPLAQGDPISNREPISGQEAPAET